MQLNSSTRYIFSYQTPPGEVADFILRSDDLASQTYARDKFFSRLNQVLEQARFLGWPIPRFGPNLPDELTEIPPPGIDHIFENQAKLLVDVAPVTRVMLQDGRYCPVRMVCGTTAAGDLVWRCHLLTGKDGTPYVQRGDKRYKVKIKGTKIACQSDSLPYDEKYMVECFGGEEGLWPIPFLPEFFSDQPIASIFSPEPGVVEVVKVYEEDPVHIFATEVVPWYRPLEIDRTKALMFDEANSEYDEDEDEDEDEFIAQPNPELAAAIKNNSESLNHLIEGWDDMQDDEKFSMDDYEEGDGEDGFDETDDGVEFTNIIASLTPVEETHLQQYDQFLSQSKINSKKQAEQFLVDDKTKEEAEEWLLSAVNRLRLLANHANKIGALISLVEKNKDQQVLIIQPRKKWAEKIVEVLSQRKISATLFDPTSKSMLSRYLEGAIKVLVTHQPLEELFIEDLTIISLSAFSMLDWLDLLTPQQSVYTIATEQLGYSDYNLVPNHPGLAIETEKYKGPGLDLLKLEPTKAKTIEKKKPKAKYKIVILEDGKKKGRPKSAANYEKALDIAKKAEEKGQICEIYAPDVSPNSKESLYVTGMPKELQGDFNQ